MKEVQDEARNKEELAKQLVNYPTLSNLNNIKIALKNT